MWSKRRLTAISFIYRFQLTVAFLIIDSTFKIADTEFVSSKDVEAALGTSVIFNCSSSIPGTDVQWNVYSPVKSMQVIYAFGKVNSEYSDRFAVHDGHNLYISSVTADDAGTYECQDDYGDGEKHSAELSVIVTNPVCHSNRNLSKVLGSNPWGVDPSQVILSCSVQYQGNKAPTLEWKKNGEEMTITAGISNEIRGNRVLHNLSLGGDSIVDGSSYNCRPAKATSTTSCTSGTISIIGASAPASQCESCQGYIAAIICICVTAAAFIGSASFVLWYRSNKFGKETITRTKRGFSTRKRESDMLLDEQNESIIKEMEKHISFLKAYNVYLVAVTLDLESHLFLREKIDYAENLSQPSSIALNKKKEIKGLTVIGNKLFVLHENCSEIDVYNTVNCEQEPSITIPEIQTPLDMTGTWDDSESLFIIGFSKRESVTTEDADLMENGTLKNIETVIARIDVSGNSIPPWPKKSDGGKGRLSTYQPYLVVFFSGGNFIKEFLPDGNMIRKVNLVSIGVTNILHAVRVTSRHFALTSRDDEDDSRTICIIDASPAIIKIYKEKKPGVPHHILVGGDGSFLVADGSLHCVFLHSFDLGDCKKLIEMENGMKPVRLCLDETREMIFVGTQTRNKDGSITAQVQIYKIQG